MKKFAIASAALTALLWSSASLAQAGAALDVSTLDAMSGTWSYRAYAGGSEAAFADVTGTQRLLVRCNRPSRQVTIIRTGVPAAAPVLAVWTSTLSRGVPSRFDLPSKSLSIDLAATDPLLDAMALSRGRFATSAVGAALMAVPTWPEPARVIEDCRS